MKLKLKYSLLLVLSVFISCDSWLDLKPVDRMPEEEVFASRTGYLDALNGLYTGLNSRTLYGRHLSAGYIDLMAEYYYNTQSLPREFLQHNYTSGSNNKAYFQSVWETMYRLIVNCNIILEHCDESNPVLQGGWYGLIKGETLALRAMMHLDLLRLFGPVPTEDAMSLSNQTKYMPYVTISDQKVSPMLNAGKVAEYIISDLREALVLLQETDPIITNGVMNSELIDADNNLRFRQYRLNYYAVKSLLARTYMWVGDKANASAMAHDVISATWSGVNGGETTAVFPWITAAAVTSSTIPDRIFSTEVIFAMYDPHRNTELYDALFSPALNVANLLTMYSASSLLDGRLTELYTDQNDYRYKMWARTLRYGTTTYVNYLRKYDYVSPDLNVAGSTPFRYMIPLIRTSEMHLILAECAETLDEGNAYVNNIRSKRACGTLSAQTQEALATNIMNEARREFIGEGQMFFFFKRKGMTLLPCDGDKTSGSRPMTLSNYVVPLPDSEKLYRAADEE